MAYKIIQRASALFVICASYLQSPLLLAIRVYFFWQLYLTGKGKLENIDKVTQFFTGLGIPFPGLNARFIGALECYGGLFLIAGLFSRPIALLVFISMTVAYLTGDMEAVSSIISDPDKFIKADPFVYWSSALIILAFGPGLFSLDALVKYVLRKRGLLSSDDSPDLRL
jgi:putative oxidoreductase